MNKRSLYFLLLIGAGMLASGCATTSKKTPPAETIYDNCACYESADAAKPVSCAGASSQLACYTSCQRAGHAFAQYGWKSCPKRVVPAN